MKKRNIYVLITSVVLVVVSAFLIIRINIKYQRGKDIVYGMHEEIPYGEGLMLQIDKSAFVSEDEMRDFYPELQKERSLRGVFVTATFKNPGLEKKDFLLPEMMIESGAFANGMDVIVFLRINDIPDIYSIKPTLESGESFSLIIPYSILNLQFTPEEWKSIEDRQFSLILSLYPQKKSILLALNE